MNNQISKIVLIFGLIFVGVFVMTDVLGGRGNSISSLAKFLAGFSLLIGVLSRRLACLLLVVYAGYTDLLKRFMVLDLRFSFADIAWVLSLPLILIGSMIVGRFLNVFLGRVPFKKVDWVCFLGAVLVCVAALGGLALKGDFSLQGLQVAANLGAYTFLPFVLIGTIRDRDELNRFLRFVLLILLPCALYGIKQWTVGLSAFEIAYLKSDMTILSGMLDESMFRPFSTVANPGGFAVLCLFCFFVCVLLLAQGSFVWNEGVRKRALPSLILISLAAIYLSGLAFSSVRSVWAVLPLIFAAWFFFRRAWGTWFVYIGGAAAGLTMILLAEVILEKQLLLKWSNTLIETAGGGDLAEKSLQLQTWSERLKGYRDVLTKPETWPLFGGEQVPQGIKIHDDISRLFYLIGAVPAFIIFITFSLGIYKIHNVIFKNTPKNGWRRSFASFGVACFVMLAIRGATAGFGLQVFPINVFMYLALAITVMAILLPHNGNTSDGEQSYAIEPPKQ